MHPVLTCEDGRACVERSLDASLGDGDCLLFHGLVNRNLPVVRGG